MRAYNFGDSGLNLTKFYLDIWLRRGDNVDTNFTRGDPYKIWEGKNVQNSARFLTTLDFNRKYLRNGSTFPTPVCCQRFVSN